MRKIIIIVSFLSVFLFIVVLGSYLVVLKAATPKQFEIAARDFRHNESSTTLDCPVVNMQLDSQLALVMTCLKDEIPLPMNVKDFDFSTKTEKTAEICHLANGRLNCVVWMPGKKAPFIQPYSNVKNCTVWTSAVSEPTMKGNRALLLIRSCGTGSESFNIGSPVNQIPQ